jgi:hypothetical protein
MEFMDRWGVEWRQEWRKAVQAWFDREVRLLHGLRTLNRWKSLYKRLGLDGVWLAAAATE